MRKMKFLAAVIITIIACFAFPMAASAVDWNAAVADPSLLISEPYVEIDNNSSGILNFSGVSLYVGGEANALPNNLVLNLTDVESVTWDAKINGTSSGTVTIQGSVEYLDLESDGEIVTSNQYRPALTINTTSSITTLTEYAAPVSIDHFNIESTGNVALSLGTPARITSCWYNGSYWFDRIKSTVNTAVVTTENLYVYASTIEGLNGIVSTGDTLEIISYETTVSSVNGETDPGANHAVSVTGTANIRSDAIISTDSTDTSNSNDSAVYTQNGTIIINDAVINGNDQTGIEIDGTGTLVMSEGNVSGYNGIYVKNTNGVAISGGSISGRTGVRIEGAAGNGVVISGGTIMATTYFEAGVVISGNNARTSSTVIRGTAVIVGGNTNGVAVHNPSASLLIENGTFSGSSSALTTNGFNSLKITGGNFSSASWNAINLSVTKTIVIQPTVSTPVILQGGSGAISLTGGGSVSIDASSYYTSTDYDGLGKTFYIQGLAPYVNSNSYKYAQFLATAPSFRVTVNDGTVNGRSSANIQAGRTVNIIPSDIPGMTFTGWTSSGVSLTNPTAEIQTFTMPLNDVTLTAVFDEPLPTFTVTFISNGGTEILPQTIESGNTAVIPTDPEREGYAFIGWYTDNETFENEYDFAAPVTEDITLYAYWIVIIGEPEPTTYTVSFNTNGGTEILPQTVESGATAVIPTEPERESYAFVGWYIDDETFVNEYDFTAPVTEDIILYAYWIVIIEEPEPTFTVTFNTNGGTAVSSQTIESGATAIIPTDPEREGYAFIGWYTDNDTFVIEYDFAMPVTEDITLYAYWIVIIEDPGPSYNPGPSYLPPSTPAEEPKPDIETDTDSSTGKKDCLVVIATLNKSGSVNSKATAEDISAAHTTAVQGGYSRMYLKIPEGGTGISASTMKKLYTAAGGTDIYLIFDFYDTYEVDESDVYGKFLLKLNDKTGQILTGLDFDTTRIQTAQNYIENRWDTEILASYETKQKSPWGDTATFSISIDRLGFKANDGEKLYALIYDTKENKWYQTSATIEDGNVIVKTKRAGIITIVTDSVK